MSRFLKKPGQIDLFKSFFVKCVFMCTYENDNSEQLTVANQARVSMHANTCQMWLWCNLVSLLNPENTGFDFAIQKYRSDQERFPRQVRNFCCQSIWLLQRHVHTLKQIWARIMREASLPSVMPWHALTPETGRWCICHRVDWLMCNWHRKFTSIRCCQRKYMAFLRHRKVSSWYFCVDFCFCLNLPDSLCIAWKQMTPLM